MGFIHLSMGPDQTSLRSFRIWKLFKGSSHASQITSVPVSHYFWFFLRFRQQIGLGFKKTFYYWHTSHWSLKWISHMELVRMNIRQTDPCPIDPGLHSYISSTQLLLPRFKSFPPYKGATTLNAMSNPLRSFSGAPSRAFLVYISRVFFCGGASVASWL